MNNISGDSTIEHQKAGGIEIVEDVGKCRSLKYQMKLVVGCAEFSIGHTMLPPTYAFEA